MEHKDMNKAYLLIDKNKKNLGPGKTFEFQLLLSAAVLVEELKEEGKSLSIPYVIRETEKYLSRPRGRKE